VLTGVRGSPNPFMNLTVNLERGNKELDLLAVRSVD